MPTTLITRTLEFDAAHRVLGHQGKCRTLHGHRYKVEFSIEGKWDDIGMVVDFGKIKAKWGDWINEYMDHGVLLGEGDLELALALTNVDPATKLWSLPYPATAEGIARALYEIFHHDSLLAGCELTAVKVWETPSCSATYIKVKP